MLRGDVYKRQDGVTVPKDIEIEKWFLNGKDDVNSSYFMEVAASEFKIQGLEIDYAVVVWEAVSYTHLDVYKRQVYV